MTIITNAGVYFRHYNDDSLLVLADRGQGIKRPLGRIIPDIKSAKEAVEITFTRVVSGRDNIVF